MATTGHSIHYRLLPFTVLNAFLSIIILLVPSLGFVPWISTQWQTSPLFFVSYVIVAIVDVLIYTFIANTTRKEHFISYAMNCIVFCVSTLMLCTRLYNTIGCWLVPSSYVCDYTNMMDNAFTDYTVIVWIIGLFIVTVYSYELFYIKDKTKKNA